MNAVILFRIAGVMNLLFLLFHLTFYWLFQWKHTLSCLGPDSRNILLTMNIVANFLLIYFTYGLLRYPRLLLQNAMGKMFLLIIAGFYFIRIFAEFYFWEFRGFPSLMIIILCAIPAICCLLPILQSHKVNYVKG